MSNNGVKKKYTEVGVILQARMGSSRLPAKVLLPFGGTTLLGWIVERLSKLPWTLVVATSTEAQDSVIVKYSFKQGIECFTGSEKNVLDRFYQCSKKYSFEHIIRLTADNPFPDIYELQRLVNFHIEGQFDYSHNFGKLPVGVGAEIFSMNALETSWKLGQELHHKEHVNEYILEQVEHFNVGYLEPPVSKHSPELVLTIDTEKDYQRIHGDMANIIESPITTELLINL
jgi:spore coat polysaccharide biosynthesis protein SpsF